jgi:regulator of protease activity HflC (stomatin/prohibitin superfamily)
VDIELTIRFKPSETQLATLHARVGPSYAETVVVPESASALRAVVGNYDPEALYAAGFETIQEQVTAFAIPQTGARFVILDDVLIKRITLPPAVVTAIERKFQQEQSAAEMQYRIAREIQEAQRKVIEAGGIEGYNNLVAPTLTAQVLQYKGIEATLELARSNNAKVIVIGAGSGGLPLILNADGSISATAPPR